MNIVVLIQPAASTVALSLIRRIQVVAPSGMTVKAFLVPCHCHSHCSVIEETRRQALSPQSRWYAMVMSVPSYNPLKVTKSKRVSTKAMKLLCGLVAHLWRPTQVQELTEQITANGWPPSIPGYRGILFLSK